MQKRDKILSLLALVVALVACNPPKPPQQEKTIAPVAEKKAQIRILRYAKTQHIPSASGVDFQSGVLNIVGDDSPFLFSLSGKSWRIKQKKRLMQPDSMVGNRIYTLQKPDYECMSYFFESGKDHILVIPSGSKEKLRDTCVVFDLSRQEIVLKKNLRPLFNQLRDSLGFTNPKQQVNIEGLAIDSKHVYLAHRGNYNGPNAIFKLDTKAFHAYLQATQAGPLAFETFALEMPNIAGNEACISGLDIVTGGGLIASASVETKQDAQYNSQVLGSFLAYIPYEKLGVEKPNFVPIKRFGQMLNTKLESVALKSQTATELRIVGVSDNDDGSSEFFEFDFTNWEH